MTREKIKRSRNCKYKTRREREKEIKNKTNKNLYGCDRFGKKRRKKMIVLNNFRGTVTLKIRQIFIVLYFF